MRDYSQSGKVIIAICLLTSVLWLLPKFAVMATTNAVVTTSSATNLCPEFTLEDQFSHMHEFKFPRDKPTVLTVADKKGSDAIKDWAHPLAERFGDKIIIAGLADVSSVPGPLHRLVRSKFKKAITYPVMLDWEGNATRSFSYTKGKANVYLVSSEGRILHHFAGKADGEKLKQLMTWVEREIRDAHEAKVRSN